MRFKTKAKRFATVKKKEPGKAKKTAKRFMAITAAGAVVLASVFSGLTADVPDYRYQAINEPPAIVRVADTPYSGAFISEPAEAEQPSRLQAMAEFFDLITGLIDENLEAAEKRGKKRKEIEEILKRLPGTPISDRRFSGFAELNLEPSTVFLTDSRGNFKCNGTEFADYIKNSAERQIYGGY
jgi:hypothetical protein